MDLGLKGRVAIVTGASRGIGRAIALALAREGCRLAVCARGAPGLEEAAAAYRAAGAEAVLPVVADMMAAEDIDRLFDATLARWGRLDVLVANVGKGSRDAFLDLAEEEWRASFELNFFSTLRCARRAAPVMVQQGSGAMVFIASIYGREAGGASPYNAAKAAVISLTKSMGRELARSGVRVNSVAPGSVLFPGGSWERRVQADPKGMARLVDWEIARGQFGGPEEVASVVAFLCSDRASHVTASCWNVDGGQSRSLA
ncbi:MAG: SDR family oxidoreductase [Chloroflexi bacterium]|nr:SDR family oxidoreductase [Chloroflexota bacterium]